MTVCVSACERESECVRSESEPECVCVCVCPPADYKRLLAQSELPAAVKADALRDDFNLDGLPQVISEVQ